MNISEILNDVEKDDFDDALIKEEELDTVYDWLAIFYVYCEYQIMK